MTGTRRFAICINNAGYEGTLELRKLYEALDDPAAASREHVRVIDESGEDYLYPASWFVALELPRKVEEAMVELISK